MSIYSFKERGPWGDAKYRGNCSGYVYHDLFQRLKPNVVIDPMVGGGTSKDVANSLGIEFYGLDLRFGFNILADSILEVVGKQADLCLSHPAYHDIIKYSGEVWGNKPHPDDLSRCGSYDEFIEKLHLAILNQREATRPGGTYGIIIGDIRRRGKYFSPQADIIARLPQGELRSVLIKAQHNCLSDSRSYGKMTLPRILHEYIVLWARPEQIISMVETLAIMARQHDERLKSTWKVVVSNALISLGGRATLNSLYEKVADNAPEKIRGKEHWKAKVRQILQLNPDMFAWESKGVWCRAA